MSALSSVVPVPVDKPMTPSPPCLAVITGLGCVSPLGVGGDDFVTNMLRTNRSAIGPLRNFSTQGLACRLGAEISAACLPDVEEARRWSRLSYMTVTACRQAVAEAGFDASPLLSQCGLVVGTEFGDLRSTEAFVCGFLRKGPLGLSPLLFPNTVMNAMAGATSIALGLRGPMLTLNQNGVAGEVAVARAIALITAGRAPAVIACGVDELCATLYETLALLQVPSPHDGGEEACRPFDRRHNGPVLGEGATALLIEAPAQAQARGATILAEVRSVSWGGPPVHPNRYPLPHQVAPRIINQALAAGAVSPHEVTVAYLSGCGNPHHDAAELALLTATFDTVSPLLTSVTHLVGEHGGLGALRVAAATVTARSGLLPRLDYLHQPLRSDVRFATSATPLPAPTVVLVHGLARGGMQTALVIGPPRSQVRTC
jgi:3-oxoacyl-[acyl-carrier-protein] synthase II